MPENIEMLKFFSYGIVRSTTIIMSLRSLHKEPCYSLQPKLQLKNFLLRLRYQSKNGLGMIWKISTSRPWGARPTTTIYLWRVLPMDFSLICNNAHVLKSPISHALLLPRPNPKYAYYCVE